MNRLAVYRYLTRYPYGCTGSGRLFTVPLSEKDNSYNYGRPLNSKGQNCSCLGCTVLEKEADDWGTLFSDNWTTGHLDFRT